MHKLKLCQKFVAADVINFRAERDEQRKKVPPPQNRCITVLAASAQSAESVSWASGLSNKLLSGEKLNVANTTQALT